MEGKKPRPVKKNCLDAPRMSKSEFTHKIVSVELYNRWKAQNGNKLTYNQFVEVWDDITTVIRDHVVNSAHGVRLPFFNGDLLANYVTGLKRHVDGKSSAEVGKEVYHLDWHSNGRPGRITWAINQARKQHKWLILFAFDPTHAFRDQVSKGFRYQPETYKLARTLSYTGYKLDEIAKRNERR